MSPGSGNRPTPEQHKYQYERAEAAECSLRALRAQVAELEKRIAYRLLENERHVKAVAEILGPDAPPVAEERRNECAMILEWVRELLDLCGLGEGGDPS